MIPNDLLNQLKKAGYHFHPSENEAPVNYFTDAIPDGCRGFNLTNNAISGVLDLREIKRRCAEFNIAICPLRRQGRWNFPHIYFLFPVQRINLSVAYHVTQASNLQFILMNGLRVGNPDLQTVPRGDCAGNLFVFERLGRKSDVGDHTSHSAYYWKNELPIQKSQPPEQSVILEVNLEGIESAFVYPDPHMKGGLVVTLIDSIPREFISRVHL